MNRYRKDQLVGFLMFMLKGKYTEKELSRLPARKLFGWYQSEKNKRLNKSYLPIDTANL